jgi:TolB-like protein/DNA-binding winged helix-turn-helix (wHTH) protein/cytochrome c-type biogenesis protein CcmH/NrfG
LQPVGALAAGAVMTIQADFPVQSRPKQLRFDRYTLDLHRGCLLLGKNEITLRPKTFAILRHLVENPGRLVSKDELFAAVWPNLAITDDVLVQSIGELRRALGDDGTRLIRTVPRRGYRFEAHVSVIGADDRPATDGAPDSMAFQDGARSPKLTTQIHTSKLFTAALTGRRGRLFAALGLVTLLSAAALWTGLGSRTTLRWAHQITENAEVGAKPAIAVLPFLNQSDVPDREYFADGLTQDIINALGRFSALTVMSWNAVFPYKGKPASPAEIARSLAVRYQVEGSVQQTGDRVRVIAQLVDADGRVLWSARFDEPLASLFALQDKIATQIARALPIRVTESEQRRVSTKSPTSLEAYDYVLRARPALLRPARAANVEARALLKHAIELDPNYAAAYAALADTYHLDVAMGWAESPETSLSRAEEMANKALGHNDSEVRARIILGRIDIFYHRYQEAQAEMDRALAINPNDALGLAGRGNILMWLGQTDAAIEALELAQRIDPELNPIDRNALGLAYYLRERYDAAIEEEELNLRKTESAHFSYVTLAAAYAQQDRLDDAVQAATMTRRTDPTFDPQAFGSKFLNPADLEKLRDGMRKAGLYPAEAGLPPPGP